jgi:hypothetical protein
MGYFISGLPAPLSTSPRRAAALFSARLRGANNLETELEMESENAFDIEGAENQEIEDAQGPQGGRLADSPGDRRPADGFFRAGRARAGRCAVSGIGVGGRGRSIHSAGDMNMEWFTIR